MSELQFDGRVAVITGAGRGIGRAYAKLLGARGASVVVNDFGGSIEGEGSDSGPAQTVVDEIVAAGGKAVPNTDDVSTAAGATAIIDTAIEQFGRIDIVVNNAGIVRYAGMPEVTLDNVERHIAVHLLGAFNTSKAAFPHMIEQGYGRIIHTTSTGMLGLDNNLPYATAKAGLVGMTRSMKLAGDPHDIKTNLIAPAAMTRMAGMDEPPDNAEAVPGQPHMPSAAVAPMVAFLAHESCPVNGEIYVAGAGRFARLFIGSTQGYYKPSGAPTIEDVAENWAEINDETGYFVPDDLMDWSGKFLAHQFQ
ncbi:SDR family NAD(P)-dependent oxidoreductase [Rhodococcoides fascians A25f]|uniref:SDR family NAD(P)-dependent oxidoreductase n=1 Tax=Rhodococcoides fascians TaxID=1828 RepID=UPI00055C4403|nr:SDR family NAD(P)-dependent oxidoreductase [Rhodococcus fascians]QII07362.1 SDR family NAD(P)-dependent oxidoreductase [Rhodococcus fascians A25f]